MADTDKPPSRTTISLASSRPKPAPKPASTSNGTKRPRALFAGDEDAEDDAATKPKNTNITSFAAGKSDQDHRPTTPPRVIAPLANKDWRAQGSAKRQKSALPGQGNAAAAPADDSEADKIASGQVKAGLQIKTPQASERSSSPEAPAETATNGTTTEQKPRTDEEKALALLKGEAAPDDTTTIAPVATTEDDAFNRDFAAAPPSPTLAQFDATPVDGFGAALLRGYLKPGQTLETWKEKQEAAMRRGKAGKAGSGVESKREGRRPDLLGMGAKELDLGGEKNKKGQQQPDLRRQKREQAEYAPLMRRNRETGEVVSQAELEGLVKGEQQGRGFVNGDGVERRERRLLENGERDGDAHGERRRERRRDDDDADRRDRERRRERELERDHDGDRDRERHRRRRDDYSDDDRDRRRRDRYDDRDRHERRHRDGSRDRHGSRR